MEWSNEDEAKLEKAYNWTTFGPLQTIPFQWSPQGSDPRQFEGRFPHPSWRDFIATSASKRSQFLGHHKLNSRHYMRFKSISRYMTKLGKLIRKQQRAWSPTGNDRNEAHVACTGNSTGFWAVDYGQGNWIEPCQPQCRRLGVTPNMVGSLWAPSIGPPT